MSILFFVLQINNTETRKSNKQTRERERKMEKEKNAIENGTRRDIKRRKTNFTFKQCYTWFVRRFFLFVSFHSFFHKNRSLTARAFHFCTGWMNQLRTHRDFSKNSRFEQIICHSKINIYFIRITYRYGREKKSVNNARLFFKISRLCLALCDMFSSSLCLLSVLIVGVVVACAIATNNK